MSFCRMSNFGQKSGRVLGLELGTWSCHLLHGTDEGWMTFMRHRLPKKVKDVIHHKLQIKNNAIQCIDFAICPSEAMQFCRMSNFVQKSGRW